MDFNYKEKVLRTDVIIQKILWYWIGCGVSMAIACSIFHWTSLSKDITRFLGISAFYIIIALFLSLPFLGIFNLVVNFYHYTNGNYSEKIAVRRRDYNLLVLFFFALLLIYFVTHFGFSYSIIDEGLALFIALIGGALFALAHSLITLSENKIRKKLEKSNQKLVLFQKKEYF